MNIFKFFIGNLNDLICETIFYSKIDAFKKTQVREYIFLLIYYYTTPGIQLLFNLILKSCKETMCQSYKTIPKSCRMPDTHEFTIKHYTFKVNTCHCLLSSLLFQK